MEWHKGMRSDVFFAAMTPAITAVAIIEPFADLHSYASFVPVRELQVAVVLDDERSLSSTAG